MRNSTQRRSGFTLTEMMVATALILFIMAIISTAFRSGIDTFSKLNTTGKLQEQLTNTTRIIQRDLSADHFETNSAFGGPKLSQQRLDQVGWEPPTAGFFAAWQTNTSQVESTSLDGESLASTFNNTPVMRFTIRLNTTTTPPLQRFPKVHTLSPPIPQLDMLPPSIINPTSGKYYEMSKWATVEYFLTNTGLTTDGGGLPLFTLRRKYIEMSDVTPSTMYGAHYLTPTVHLDNSTPPKPTGDDILLVNVTRFEVKYLWTGPEYGGYGYTGPKMPQLPYTPPSTVGSPGYVAPGTRITSALYAAGPLAPVADQADWPYSDLPLDNYRGATPSTAWPQGIPLGRQDNSPARFFDTSLQSTNAAHTPIWNVPPYDDRQIPPMMMGGSPTPNPNATLPAQPPLRIRILAIQFKIRIYDEKTGQSRQVTITQEV